MTATGHSWLVRVGFVLALVILVLIGLGAYQQGTENIAAARWVAHSYNVQRQLTLTLSTVQDIVIGARGYVITGKDEFLEPFHNGQAEIPKQIQALRQLMADNPEQQTRIEFLESLIARRIELSQASITLRQTKGQEVAEDAVSSGGGKQVMDQIRKVIEEMQTVESALLIQRTERLRASNLRVLGVFIAMLVFLAGLLLATHFLVRRDAAAREREHQIAQKAYEYAENIVDTVRESLVVLNANLRVLSANRSFYQTFQVTRLETAGVLFYELSNGQWDISALRSLLEEVLPKDSPIYNFEVERDFPIIGRRTMLLNARKTFRVGNNTQSILLAIEDITDRKRAEEERDRIFTLSLDMICIAGFDGYFKQLNPAWTKTLGFTIEELLARPYLEFIHLDDRERTVAEAAKLATGLDTISFENRYLCKDGSYKWLVWSATPFPGQQLIYAMAHNITERKRAEEVILRAKEEALRTSKFKDQFLSTMSHELRTPLNAVLGFSELLADDRYGPLNDKQRRYVGHIYSGGQHLLKLINDILDLSKIEAGRLELAIEEVPVATAFAEVASALRPLAEKKSQSLVQECIENLAVRADSMRFKQILMNLLGNAIKFTPEGGHIKLSAHSVDSKVRVEVRDTGPGIPPEEQVRIFESFYRLRQTGQAPEGTGLGLSITQRLVELHGGELALESQPGQGSCFFFSLPALVGFGRTEMTKQKEPAMPQGVPRILIIEDDPTAAHLIELQLSASGYEPVICNHPQRAVEIAAELHPHAITLDLLMKPVTGWELLMQLKTDARTKAIPVIVLTIVDQPGMGMTLGADEYLVKPVEKETLLAAVARCMDSRGSKLAPRPILVVEDDAATREVIAELLQTNGFTVATVADGALARSWVEASLPELVILDLLLPNVSGFELLAAWRASPRTADVPVFVLTGKDLTPAEQETLRTQAEFLLRKQQPWQEDLLKQLRRIVPQVSPEG
jgi:PAS domain S-box-containing protein